MRIIFWRMLQVVVDNEQLEKIMKALAKFNIFNEEDLAKAMQTVKPLNVACMTMKSDDYNKQKAVV